MIGAWSVSLHSKNVGDTFHAVSVRVPVPRTADTVIGVMLLHGSTTLWDGRFGVRILSRPTLGLTHRPVRWVPETFPGSKAVGAWLWPLQSTYISSLECYEVTFTLNVTGQCHCNGLCVRTVHSRYTGLKHNAYMTCRRRCGYEVKVGIYWRVTACRLVNCCL